MPEKPIDPYTTSYYIYNTNNLKWMFVPWLFVAAILKLNVYIFLKIQKDWENLT